MEDNLADEIYSATGRRKESVAQVRLKPGSGKITVNGKEINTYLCRMNVVTAALKPIEVSDLAGRFDIDCVCRGGGLSGQAGAICLGIARALLIYDIELRNVLKRNGLLTRDSRMVERKKYGLVKARKRYQFSKR
ncbi:MAG TPA: 30S ribosomal protein S9 [candidate division Zixibacteria bacterium]|nr:30S ribosomal protein S9 [candidate division Zixibacteria bacterium]HBY99973.1 30S ribosomal protein S9 [candidate division Zixibacteria bacterium]